MIWKADKVVRQCRTIVVLSLMFLSQQAMARVTVHDVTQETQKEQELNFKLSLLKSSPDLYNVRFDAPKEGKLEKCSGASLQIWDGGKLLLSVSFQGPSNDKNISFAFSIHKELFNKASLRLDCGDAADRTTWVAYKVHLESYPVKWITEK